MRRKGQHGLGRRHVADLPQFLHCDPLHGLLVTLQHPQQRSLPSVPRAPPDLAGGTAPQFISHHPDNRPQ